MTSLKRVTNTLRPLRPILSTLKYVAAVHLILEWVVSFNMTSGPSMLPTIALERDWVCISKLHARGRGVAVGDLISFKSPIEPGANSLKRVLGMPGDFVERDTLSTNGEGRLLRVPDGHCFVVGDNIAHSRDSRLYGAIPLGLVNGKVIGRVWPWPPTRYQSALSPPA